MGKVVVFNMVTVDGFFAGPKGEIDWHNVDSEFNKFAVAQLKEAGLLIFGKKTYRLMAGYWPTSLAAEDDRVVAGLMNDMPKIVFSKTLKRADWKNTKLQKGINAGHIEKLKKESRKDLLIFGSGEIVRAFAKRGLIDEFRLMVNPVVLGQGRALFKDKINLKFLKLKIFGNGNVLLIYEPIKNERNKI